MTMPDINALFRRLPAVDALLNSEKARSLISDYGREMVVSTTRDVIENLRDQLRGGKTPNMASDTVLEMISGALQTAFTPTLLPVINASGVIIHTNLGRAPLSVDAQQAIQQIATNYNTLEFDLENGKRGSRLLHAEALLQEITGAEAALVVNNNAAATVLMLAGLAQGREVIVSRGQLVEIGGGFRVPDVMRQSGAILVEVGTTNRTRIADYANALTENSDLLMRVHSSNFKLTGFVEETDIAEMVELATTHEHLKVVDDLGSGALIDTAQFGLAHEPMVQDSVRAGADVIAFSGDKLLGGPQAGILIGKASAINPLKRHPLARAMRADKLCLAALTATLDHYRRGEALAKIPVLRMMAYTVDDLHTTAHAWMDTLQHHIPDARLQVIEGESTVGGGSIPGSTLPTALLAIEVDNPEHFMHDLRHAPLPVIPRIIANRVVVDPRTVLPHQSNTLLETLKSVLASL